MITNYIPAIDEQSLAEIAVLIVVFVIGQGLADSGKEVK